MSEQQKRIDTLTQHLRELQDKIAHRRNTDIEAIESSIADVQKQEDDNQIRVEAQIQALMESFLGIEDKIKESHSELEAVSREFDARFAQLQENIKTLVGAAANERIQCQSIMMKSIDDSYRELTASVAELERGLADELERLREGADDKLRSLGESLTEEGDSAKSAEARVRDFATRAFASVEKRLQEEEEKGTRSEKALRELLGAVEKQFDRDLRKVREERKAGEDALVDLLEKMANNFIALTD